MPLYDSPEAFDVPTAVIPPEGRNAKSRQNDDDTSLLLGRRIGETGADDPALRIAVRPTVSVATRATRG